MSEEMSHCDKFSKSSVARSSLSISSSPPRRSSDDDPKVGHLEGKLYPRAEQGPLLASSKKRKGLFSSSPSLSSLSFLSPCLTGRKLSQISLGRMSSRKNEKKWSNNFFIEDGNKTCNETSERILDSTENLFSGVSSQRAIPTSAEVIVIPGDDATSSSSDLAITTTTTIRRDLTSSSPVLSQHSISTLTNSVNPTPPCSPTAHRSGTRWVRGWWFCDKKIWYAYIIIIIIATVVVVVIIIIIIVFIITLTTITERTQNKCWVKFRTTKISFI